MVWAAGGALALVWGRFSTRAATEHYTYSGFEDRAMQMPLKRQLNVPTRRIYGQHEKHHKTAAKKYDSAPSAPPRWTLAGAILGSPGAFPAQIRRWQSVKHVTKRNKQ